MRVWWPLIIMEVFILVCFSVLLKILPSPIDNSQIYMENGGSRVWVSGHLGRTVWTGIWEFPHNQSHCSTDIGGFRKSTSWVSTSLKLSLRAPWVSLSMKRCSGNTHLTEFCRWSLTSSFSALVLKQKSVISLCQFLFLSKSQWFHDGGLLSLPSLSLIMVRGIYLRMNACRFKVTPDLGLRTLFPFPQLYESTSDRAHEFSLWSSPCRCLSRKLSTTAILLSLNSPVIMTWICIS